VSSPPQPTQLSSAFRLIVGGALLTCAAIFILALHRPHRSALADIRPNTDTWWTRFDEATPRPTPRVLPTPHPRPLLVVQTPPRPAPMPAPKPVSESWLRYRRAIETGMGGNTDNVRELPQLHASGQPAPSPTPNIFAYGAYPHE